MASSAISTMKIRSVNLKTVIIASAIIDTPCNTDISKLERNADFDHDDDVIEIEVENLKVRADDLEKLVKIKDTKIQEKK